MMYSQNVNIESNLLCLLTSYTLTLFTSTFLKLIQKYNFALPLGGKTVRFERMYRLLFSLLLSNDTSSSSFGLPEKIFNNIVLNYNILIRITSLIIIMHMLF